jgi:hypothetical protein
MALDATLRQIPLAAVRRLNKAQAEAVIAHLGTYGLAQGSPLDVTLQSQDDAHDLPRVDMAEVLRHMVEGVELTAYVLDPDPGDDDPQARIMDVVFLPWPALARLFEVWALRHPAQARRLLTKALGWQGERGGPQP